MPASFTQVLALTRVAAATLTADRFVTLGGAVPAAGDAGCGVLAFDAESGDLITVYVMGTAVVEAGAAIADGALVQTDATGLAITKAAGATLGRALKAAGAAGEKIEVLLIQS